MLRMAKDGTFKYGGRDNAPDPVFLAGQSAISFNSSAYRGSLAKGAKFAFADAFLPYDPTIIKQPINSIIGGASLWAMTAPNRTAAEYKALALFLKYIGQPKVDSTWAEATGYVPVTLAGAKEMQTSGFFDKTPAPNCRCSSSSAGMSRPTRAAFVSAGYPKSATSSPRSSRRRCKAA